MIKKFKLSWVHTRNSDFFFLEHLTHHYPHWNSCRAPPSPQQKQQVLGIFYSGTWSNTQIGFNCCCMCVYVSVAPLLHIWCSLIFFLFWLDEFGKHCSNVWFSLFLIFKILYYTFCIQVLMIEKEDVYFFVDVSNMNMNTVFCSLLFASSPWFMILLMCRWSSL